MAVSRAAGFLQPFAEEYAALDGDVLKCEAHAQTFLRVNNPGGGFEAFGVGENLEGNRAVDRQSIQHVHVTTVETQFGYLGIKLAARTGVGQFGNRDERVPRSAAFFGRLVVHEECLLHRL